MVKVRLYVYLLLIFTSFLPSLLVLPSWWQNRHCLIYLLLLISDQIEIDHRTHTHIQTHANNYYFMPFYVTSTK